jgi:hypothetical protein
VEGVSKLLGKISEAQSVEGQEEQVMLVNNDDVALHDADEEGVAMKEEPCGGSGMFSSPGDDGTGSFGLWNMETATVLRSKSVHISSAILAAKSPYFYKVCRLRF